MPTLVVMAGLPASGKSSIARELARQMNATWLRIDSMDQAIWASGDAPTDLRDWTYRAAQAVALDNLGLGHDVVGDCVNDSREARDGWAQIGRRSGATVLWLEVVCSDREEHRRRVETRTSDIPGLALPDWDAVIKRDYDSWEWDRLTIDTACRSLEECVDIVLAALAAKLPP
jgi:predicted kinase